MARNTKEVNTLAITLLYPNPDQPRKTFNRQRLESLADSIKQNGLLEPIVVVKRDIGYMIVCGERRWRACNMAGLTEAPVRVIAADSTQIATLALLENLQREDLNPIEEATAYAGLMDMGMSINAIAEKMGFKQAWRVRERMDLLRLRRDLQTALIDGRINNSQAFEMSRLNHDAQGILYDKIITGKADTYNKLRAIANHLLMTPPQQADLFSIPPDPEANKVYDKYEQLLEKLCVFVKKSFSEKDMKVLPKVIKSDTYGNVKRLESVISDLLKIKKAMVQATAAFEVAEG